jgi:prepilin-type N-terminal cleavage/methylation domain-containing protein
MKLSKRRSTFAARGFTLIELVIVLVIMSIVIAVAGPRVAGGLLGMSIRSAALQTAAMLRYARSKAVNTGTGYHVIFDGIDRRVILLQAASDEMDSPRPAAMDDEPERLGRNVRTPEDDFDDTMRTTEQEKKIYALPDGVRFDNVLIADVDSASLGDEVVMMLTFLPNGTSQGAYLTIADQRDRRYYIAVDPVSGSVRVDEDPDDA